MNSIQTRFLLFFFGCIVIRLTFVYLSKTYTEYLPFFGILGLFAVIGWVNILFFKKKDYIEPEIFGDKIWWNDMRPVHMVLFLIFTILALQKNKSAWIFLLIDTIIGLSAFLIYHYNAGDFSKLI